MTDKPNSKFPYILLPNLSGDNNNTTSTTPERGQGPPVSVPKTVKLPRIQIFPTSGDQSHGDSIAKTVPSASTSSSNQHPTQPSKGMSRHIALSKQYAINSPPMSTSSSSSFQPTRRLSKELLDTRAQVYKAHFDLRSSPRSFYPSSIDADASIVAKPELSSRKLDLEAISALLPHNRPSKVKPSSNLKKSTAPSAATAAKSFLDKVRTSSSAERVPSSESSSFLIDQLQARLEGLTVHVKNRDAEVAKLRESLTQLQSMILKERQDTSSTDSLMTRLSSNMELLSDKLEGLQDKLAHQERNILNKLLLIDEMECSSEEDDDDYGGVECRPSNWIPALPATSSSSSNSTIQPVAKVTPAAVPVRKSHQSGINSLKECVNWVPIAPDFDKLLNVIALLNFRMDRNQSMQIARNGNEVTFKHADTIPLAIYKNGLTLANTGFRSYATLSVIKLVNELFSGYFPSELHSQYPDGIVFVVSDKRSMTHELCPGFNGPGVKLQNDPKSAPVLLPGAERLSRKLDRSKTDLLKSKSDLSIASSCASDVSICPSRYCLLPDLNKLAKHGGGHKMICLKLKNIANGHLYKLKLSTGSTIDAVLEHLERHLRPPSSPSETNLGSGDSNLSKTSEKFEIVLPHPNGILSSGHSTLKEYGLVTNTLLYIQPVSSIELTPEPTTSTEDSPEELATS